MADTQETPTNNDAMTGPFGMIIEHLNHIEQSLNRQLAWCEKASLWFNEVADLLKKNNKRTKEASEGTPKATVNNDFQLVQDAVEGPILYTRNRMEMQRFLYKMFGVGKSFRVGEIMRTDRGRMLQKEMFGKEYSNTALSSFIRDLKNIGVVKPLSNSTWSLLTTEWPRNATKLMNLRAAENAKETRNSKAKHKH